MLGAALYRDSRACRRRRCGTLPSGGLYRPLTNAFSFTNGIGFRRRRCGRRTIYSSGVAGWLRAREAQGELATRRCLPSPGAHAVAGPQAQSSKWQLAIRVLLVAGVVGVCYLFHWDWLRFLTATANRVPIAGPRSSRTRPRVNPAAGHQQHRCEQDARTGRPDFGEHALEGK